MPRSRLLQVALVTGTIVVGLASRKYAYALPGWAAKNAGDALYATMAFFGVGLLWPRLPVAKVALAAVGYCFVIEFSQLLHTPWLDALRERRLGALVLGQGFHALDLFDYLVGVFLGVGVDQLFQARRLGKGRRAASPRKVSRGHSEFK